MQGAQLMGWDATNEIWIYVQVDTDGQLLVATS